jgi:hypothetical protein
MPCSLGNSTQANPAIADWMITHSVAACVASAGYMATACAVTGPAYLACLGDGCTILGLGTLTTGNTAFALACRP